MSDRDPVAVTVRPMTDQEFQSWRESSVVSYAESIAAATGRPLDAALARARTQFTELLPAGQDSARTWVLRVLDEDGTPVGVLWIGPHQDRADAAYIFEIEIDEAHRRRGLGRAAMTAAEDIVAAAGVSELGLNVFGFNDAARRLYASLGYRVVATQMTKKLSPGQAERD